LANDAGNRAQDALDALAYNEPDIKLFNDLLTNIVASVKLSINSEGNIDKRLLHEKYTEAFSKELREVYGVLIMNPTLEMRNACSDIITKATTELVNLCTDMRQRAIIDTCDFGHKFAKLPDHPLRDGKARCPHCLASGLDGARDELNLLQQGK